jgi:hypothetical protein
MRVWRINHTGAHGGILMKVTDVETPEEHEANALYRLSQKMQSTACEDIR